MKKSCVFFRCFFKRGIIISYPMIVCNLAGFISKSNEIFACLIMFSSCVATMIVLLSVVNLLIIS